MTTSATRTSKGCATSDPRNDAWIGFIQDCVKDLRKGTVRGHSMELNRQQTSRGGGLRVRRIRYQWAGSPVARG